MKILLIVGVVLLSFVLLGFAGFAPCSQIFGQVTSKVITTEKTVFLTFDDGPSQNTLEVLEILKKHNVSATFFLIGQNALENPTITKQIVAQTHSIGVHSMTHPYLFNNNHGELSNAKTIIENITNQKVALFRPPYGFRTPTTIKTAKNLNMTVITWTIFPRDYKNSKDVIIKTVLDNLGPGAIIVLHDHTGNRNNTLEALPIIIEQSRIQGYQFKVLN
ncbi:polysaccharide deacetylase family protein [Candidatus Woesearchaeota archaeon]|nr:polysaccharide deacetylase family protein [Candidatus Woesearchaeota archaeon]